MAKGVGEEGGDGEIVASGGLPGEFVKPPIPGSRLPSPVRGSGFQTC